MRINTSSFLATQNIMRKTWPEMTKYDTAPTSTQIMTLPVKLSFSNVAYLPKFFTPQLKT